MYVHFLTSDMLHIIPSLNKIFYYKNMLHEFISTNDAKGNTNTVFH